MSRTERFSLYPIIYQDIFDMHKKIKDNLWLADEVTPELDLNDLSKLSDNERYFLKNILAFFNQADGIVNENLCMRFSVEVTMSEARHFYNWQIFNEGVHSETYGKLLHTYFSGDPEYHKLFDAISHLPAITKKAQWAEKWIRSCDCFATRLRAFAIIEGVFFQGSFASIYWFKEKGLLTSGLAVANEWIARDETFHGEFAVALYDKLAKMGLEERSRCLADGVDFNVLSEQKTREMMMEAVGIEIEFLTKSLPVDLIGMNSRMMAEYIKCCADYWMGQFGYSKIYNAKDPFGFTMKIGLQSKNNFFEKATTEYTNTVTNKDLNNLDDIDF